MSARKPSRELAVPGPANSSPVSLRIIDHETARVVAVHRPDGAIVGAGCLLDGERILTCRHVLEAATVGAASAEIIVSLPGVERQPSVYCLPLLVGGAGPENDIAVLLMLDPPPLAISPAEFASPIRHSGKTYSVLGFPDGDRQGRNASGRLHAADTRGLVQMDRGSSLLVHGGFSGAPVWCPEVHAFVGMVVTELANAGVAWCIPSRILCQFDEELIVRFRVPVSDRPEIHDFEQDDPNVQIYGTASESGGRRLEVTVKDWGDGYVAKAVYECLPSPYPPPRGRYVTFITHPSYTNDSEDSYELFSHLEPVRGRPGLLRAEAEFYPEESFTLAAVGDGGDTALTFNLKHAKKLPRGFR